VNAAYERDARDLDWNNTGVQMLSAATFIQQSLKANWAGKH
jgi:hypothetical protein